MPTVKLFTATVLILLQIACSNSENTKIKDPWKIKPPYLSGKQISLLELITIDINDEFDFISTNLEKDLANTQYQFQTDCSFNNLSYNKAIESITAHKIQVAHVLPEEVLFNPKKHKYRCHFKIKAQHLLANGQSSLVNMDISSTLTDLAPSSIKIKTHSLNSASDLNFGFSELPDYMLLSEFTGKSTLQCERFKTQPIPKENFSLSFAVFNFQPDQLIRLSKDGYSITMQKSSQICRAQLTTKQKVYLSEYFNINFPKPELVFDATYKVVDDIFDTNAPYAHIKIINSKNVMLNVTLPLRTDNSPQVNCFTSSIMSQNAVATFTELIYSNIEAFKYSISGNSMLVSIPPQGQLSAQLYVKPVQQRAGESCFRLQNRKEIVDSVTSSMQVNN